MKKGNLTLAALCFACTLIAISLSSCQKSQLKIKIESGNNEAQVLYAINRLEEASGESHYKLSSRNADIIIKASIAERLGPESFTIAAENNVVVVEGGDATGLMYGLLEIKEQLEKGNQVIQDVQESPHLNFRALKFNLPWNSYRVAESLSLHYETCRDTLFWIDFLDMMAENRFNALTLWNLHPFNYLVKTQKYPEACGFTDEEMVEWEQFWTSLFRMAKDRGIETYLVNWNIFVSPEFARAHNLADYHISGEYYVIQGDTAEIIKDYTREVVRDVINKYPDLTGLGITLGEGMGNMTADARSQWLLDSFIEGMRMADRKIRFIYRVPLSAGTGSGGSTSVEVEKLTRATLDTLTCITPPIIIELKFNWSHAHSTPHLAKVHGGKLNDTYWNPAPENYFLAWMMRNEDFFTLRWGQADFIRRHLAQNVHPWVDGYFVGSETYIPAKDYLTSLEGTSYKYAYERQWMFYKQWGRLLYNPESSDGIFKEAFELRFPEYGTKLYNAQELVGKVPLIIASYWNAAWDFTLYSEGMASVDERQSPRKMAVLPLTIMAEKIPMEPSWMSINEFVSGEGSEKISPLALADSLSSFCTTALMEVEAIDPQENIDLLYEVSDIRSWAYLGLYFSNKLRAAVEYRKYMVTNNKAHLSLAVSWLEKASEDWRNVVSITTPIYKPFPVVHYDNSGQGYFHWSIAEAEVENELNWLKNLTSE